MLQGGQKIIYIPSTLSLLQSPSAMSGHLFTGCGYTRGAIILPSVPTISPPPTSDGLRPVLSALQHSPQPGFALCTLLGQCSVPLRPGNFLQTGTGALKLDGAQAPSHGPCLSIRGSWWLAVSFGDVTITEVPCQMHSCTGERKPMIFEPYHSPPFFFFSRPHLWHMEAARQGVESELQLPATATGTRDLSLVCDLHSSWQRQILNPLNKARGQTRILWTLCQILNLLSHVGNSALLPFNVLAGALSLRDAACHLCFVSSGHGKGSVTA